MPVQLWVLLAYWTQGETNKRLLSLLLQTTPIMQCAYLGLSDLCTHTRCSTEYCSNDGPQICDRLLESLKNQQETKPYSVVKVISESYLKDFEKVNMKMPYQ